MIAAALAGSVVVPLTGAQPAAAATCVTSVPTYVWEPNTTGNPAATRVLHKYMDWGPKSGATDTLIDTLATASLKATSQVFTGGGNGIIYEATLGGQVKTYKDNTATGGSLLTAVKTYNLAWQNAKRIWTNGSRVFVLQDANTLEVYTQSDPTTGNGTLTKLTETGTQIAALFDATKVWMVNSTAYALTSTGTINQYNYTETQVIGTTSARFTSAGAVVTGLTNVSQAWSPGAGAVNTQTTTSDPDTTGQIAKYSTGPWAQLDPEMRTGIVGTIMADAGPCLANPDASEPPYFGTPPDETGGEAAVEAPADTPQTPSNTVTGKFTLGNGQPAPGLRVALTANDLTDVTGQTQVPLLGTATTAADGSWSITLPDPLPADVQQTKDANGGILNLEATAEGVTTTTDTPVLGVDVLSTTTAHQSATAAAQTGEGHTTFLAPNTVTGTTQDTYAASTDTSTLAAKIEADPAPAPDTVPLWQSDSSTLAADYNPYLINGHDISAEAVRPPSTPMNSGNCWLTKTQYDSTTKYTVVGEAHSGWDAKSAFEYESSMNTSIDMGIKTTNSWSIGSSKDLSTSTGASLGWGPNKYKYSHQYTVPILYKKYKQQSVCGGVARSTWYTLEASKYYVPGGWAIGKVGKDVSSKDGPSAFSKSNPSYRAYLQPNNFISLSSGKSVKFGGAVSAFGISLGSKTGYDTNHRQRLQAGNQSGKHWIWGKNGKVSSGKAGVFYSK
ncbi:hypothetical protein AB8A21_36940 [Streptomyces sp. BF23-18]|uniref:hypothetical protein n=1 Tax=Streptomyces sp. BF23-18 TaxID=3240282 RepID=UPI0034E3B9A8